jgi:uncharacterized protein YqeY
MGLVAKVAAELLEAMKARDERKVSVLRMLKAEFQKAQADKGRALELTEDDAMALVRRLMKQRKDAAEQYEAAGASDRAREELSEVPILEQYLPQQLGDDELDALIEEAAGKMGAVSSKDMGKLMGTVMSSTAGRADGKRVKDKVTQYLASKDK